MCSLRRPVMTDAESAYICSMRPAGFVRAWEALYRSKCLAGPWVVRRWPHLTVAIERGNRVEWMRETFGPYVGWAVTVPLGFGSLAVWGYERRCAA